MNTYRIDLTIGLPGFVDAEEWQLVDGWFLFRLGDEIRARYAHSQCSSFRVSGGIYGVPEYTAKTDFPKSDLQHGAAA